MTVKTNGSIVQKDLPDSLLPDFGSAIFDSIGRDLIGLKLFHTGKMVAELGGAYGIHLSIYSFTLRKVSEWGKLPILASPHLATIDTGSKAAMDRVIQLLENEGEVVLYATPEKRYVSSTGAELITPMRYVPSEDVEKVLASRARRAEKQAKSRR